MKLQMSFGENLINLRKQKGWSQDDLADNLNLSRQAISKWENETSKPDIDNIKKISKIFSVKIDDLLNNDVVKDKAVTLNVKKQEKREKTITIVKCMIIAVIILYIINVIFKFASLLIIVNGVQKYANLSNYHYVITTYDENGLAETEECWFKDGISKTINISYNNNVNKEILTYVNFNESKGYICDNNKKQEIDVNYYLLTHVKYEFGNQLYSKFPNEIKIKNIIDLFVKSLELLNVEFDKEEIYLKTKNVSISLSSKNFMPIIVHNNDYVKDHNFITDKYDIEINTIQEIN